MSRFTGYCLKSSTRVGSSDRSSQAERTIHRDIYVICHRSMSLMAKTTKCHPCMCNCLRTRNPTGYYAKNNINSFVGLKQPSKSGTFRDVFFCRVLWGTSLHVLHTFLFSTAVYMKQLIMLIRAIVPFQFLHLHRHA